MKLINTLANERFARGAAQIMCLACYLVMVFLLLVLALSLIGRQTFILHTSAGTYDQAIYAEEDHDPPSRSFTVSIADSIHVWANEEDQIDLTTQIGLVLVYAVHLIPLIFAYWFLSRVFSHVHQGQIFTEQNALCLFYYGLLQFFTALFVPFLKLFFCWLSNLVSDSRISLSVGSNILSALVPSIAFFVAAYIIHYGISLQDEVDHTL